MEGYRIEVVGAGVVGSATGAALTAWGHDVVYTELRPERREELREEGKETAAPEEPVAADLSVVTVPTPYDESADGLDTAHVEAAIERIAETDTGRVVAIRSTVPPGTTERLSAAYGLDHVAMVPEFLFAKTATEDAKNVVRVVVGTESSHARERIESAFAHNEPEFVSLSPSEAELLKFASNAYGATKISFANELWRIAGAGDVDRDRVLDAFRTVSPWVGNTRGLAGGWPYGGACLPKDTNGYRGWLRDEGVAAPQLDGTIAENDLMRERDLEASPYGRW